MKETLKLLLDSLVAKQQPSSEQPATSSQDSSANTTDKENVPTPAAPVSTKDGRSPYYLITHFLFLWSRGFSYAFQNTEKAS